MSINLEKLNRNKDQILSLINMRGPSLPVQIARAIGLEPLFASAFLSELYAEGRIKLSNLRVGSSPLYYISGQEHMLEKFIEHLNQREKEALRLLKKENILEDEKLNPITRVALRAIRDFAIPVKIRIKEDSKLFWKYFLFPDSDISSLISKKVNPPTESNIEEPQIPLELKQELKPLTRSTPQKTQETIIQINQPDQKKSDNSNQSNLTKQKKKPKESKFANNLKEYLSSKDIELLEVLEEKKKEFYAKVRTNSLFGKQEYLLTAKDKKKISDTDLTLAHQKAQLEKMPALFLSPGDLDKKAQEHIKFWKNLIKFEKVRI